MERTSAKRQKTEEIQEEKYSLSSLLLNGRNFSILMSLVFLAAFSPYWKTAGETILEILKAVVGD